MYGRFGLLVSKNFSGDTSNPRTGEGHPLHSHLRPCTEAQTPSMLEPLQINTPMNMGCRWTYMVIKDALFFFSLLIPFSHKTFHSLREFSCLKASVFNTVCRMVSVRSRLLLFGKLTYFTGGFRSSNISRNGQQQPL